jgi:hypothetical protein
MQVAIRPMAVVWRLQASEGNGSLARPKTMWARAFARRCGAYLALVGLTLQLALSFAHVHKHDLAFSGFAHADVVSVAYARSTQRAVEQLPSPLADDDDHCPICFSGFLLLNSSLPEALASPRPLQFAEIDRAFNPVSDGMFRPRHPAFLSRAPPTA